VLGNIFEKRRSALRRTLTQAYSALEKRLTIGPGTLVKIPKERRQQNQGE
jgi:hypothetical protein